MRLYTKEELIEVFKDIKSKGWIESGRQGNAGGVGEIYDTPAEALLAAYIAAVWAEEMR